MKNKLKVIGIASIIALLLVTGMMTVGRTAISELVGLGVAQSATLWNSVADAAKGDSLSSGVLAMSPYLWNGVSFDRTRGSGGSMNVAIVGAVTPADAYANPTTASQMWSLNGVFNGTTWDRQRTTTADALASTGIAASGNVLFNGTTFDRQDSASATNNTAVTTLGVAYSTPLSTWSVTNTVNAAITAATASKAAGGGAVRHVATGVTLCYSDSAIGAVAQVNLRDGATGAGTIIRSWLVALPVAGGSQCENLSGLNMTGSANTAMTLEFGAATAATSSKTVTLTGYSTP
jgi:hypothetical protein